MERIAKIKSVEHVTHDVLHWVLEKPDGITYRPGQAVDISINQPEWKNEIRTFTFTSLPDDDIIEFTTKTYPERKSVTNHFLSLKAGDEWILHDVYGDIAYKGEGLFIAGGAGITPFYAILRQLAQQHKVGNNKLIFANKTRGDIIYKDKFEKLLGKNFINILSHEDVDGYEHGFVTAELIKKYAGADTKYYYLCGPPPMMDAVEKQLVSLGVSADNLVKEGF